MENVQNQPSVRLYEMPTVIYEATLVVHAGVSSVPPCDEPLNDVLDFVKGN